MLPLEVIVAILVDIWDGSFAMNEEALANFSQDQIKKTHDVAMHLIQKALSPASLNKCTFPAAPMEVVNRSMAFQHWPEDYDGIITLYPAFNWTAKFIKDNRNVKSTLCE